MARRGQRSILIGVALSGWFGVVWAHYAWTVAPGQPFTSFQHYHLLTDAFLAGRTSLLWEPAPELLALPDPYDPVSNAPLRRCHDCSLFDGKYYLYFGLAPLLTLFLPYRLVTGVHLAEKHAALVFFWGAVVLQSLLILWLWRRLCPRAARSTGAALLLLVAFSGFQPFLLRRAVVYEVPPAAGAFFVSGAALCLVSTLTAAGRLQLRLALGSLCLGLAVASRPHHVLVAPLLLLLYAQLVRRAGGESPARLAAALFGPLALTCLGVAAYNQLRFGRFWEFGQTYILDAFNHPKTRYFSLEYIPSHLLLSLFSPPSVDFDFPFFHMHPAWFPELPHERNVLEAMAGVFPCVPAFGLALVSPLLARRVDAPCLPLAAWGVGLAAAAAIVATFVASFRVGSVRYYPDFCTYLALSAAIVALLIDHQLAPRGAARALFRLALALLVLYGTAVNLAVGLTGYFDQYRKSRPEEYRRIEDFFFPVQRALLRWTGGHGALRLHVRLHEGTISDAQTVARLVSDGGEDALCVRRRADGRVLLYYHRAGQPPLRSAPLELAAGEAHVVELEAGSLYPHLWRHALERHFPSARGQDPRAALRIRLDGREALHARFDFEPGSARFAAGPGTACPAYDPALLLRVEQEIP